MKKERKYYGCKHCGSWCIKSLNTCIGDSRDGIRSDYKCNVCGGVYGSAAHGHVFISESEWYEYAGEKMPKVNKERKLAMEILIALEKNYDIDVKSSELEMVEIITPLIQEHHKNLLKTKNIALDRLERIREIA